MYTAAGVVAAPGHLEEARVVLHAERDVVAGPHAGGPQQLRQAVGRGVELGVRRDGAGRWTPSRTPACRAGSRRRHRGTRRRTVPGLPSSDGSRGGAVRPTWPASHDLLTGDPDAVPLAEAARRCRRCCGRGPRMMPLASSTSSPHRAPSTTLDGLRRHLYDELGFAGDPAPLRRPATPMLDLVLEGRRGPADPAGDGCHRGRAAHRRALRGHRGCRCTSWCGRPRDDACLPSTRSPVSRWTASACASGSTCWPPGGVPWDEPPSGPDAGASHRAADADQPAGVLRATRLDPRRRRPRWRGCGRRSPARTRRHGRSAAPRRRVQLARSAANVLRSNGRRSTCRLCVCEGERGSGSGVTQLVVFLRFPC